MAEENKTKGKLPWHSAFFAGIQIELEKDAHKLTFENEHQLGTDPMRIDVFYKVLGYACFYKSDVQYVDSIKIGEITISYVSKSYPRKLIQHLKTVRGYHLVPKWKGIWYIEDGMFPMQLIVTSKLSKNENFWLKNLTNDLKKKEEADQLFEEYGKYKDSSLHKSVMDLVMRANQKVFKEARGDMCDALYELMKDEIDAAVQEASKGKPIEQIKKKLVKGKSVEQIADELEESVETIRELMKSIN